MSAETVRLLTPEIVLIAVAVAIFVAGAFADAPKWFRWIAGAGVALSAVALWMQHGAAVCSGPLTIDSLAYYGRWLALVLGALFVLLTARPLAGGGTPEYVGSLLLAIAGLMLVSGAGELVLMFVGLELISIPTYVLLYLGRRDAASQESAVKYFLLSILASAILLYGLGFLYGTTGSTELGEIHAALAGSRPALPDAGAVPVGFDMFARLALVLIFAGLGFKIAAAPFHFYAPDVYQGTTQANAALLSVVPKAAGMVALVRILVLAMPGLEAFAWKLALVMAVLTMTLGNFMALWQNNLRRLLAYSSIAHAGYMLIGLTVGLAPAIVRGSQDGVGALLFYLCVYALATVGAFAVLEYLGREDAPIDAVDELAGLGRARPLVAAAMSVFLFSLAGIPLLAGFWGKFALFLSALGVDPGGVSVRPWFVGLAIVGALNAAVAAAYYLRIVGVMFFRTPLAVPKAEGGMGPWLTFTVCAVLTLAIGAFPRPLLQAANDASRQSSVQRAAPDLPPVELAGRTGP
ncbi:MAG: NADH-quinone oxidoreductase subunit N [Pirellulales bacterium]|nr:NADH-quinone oxidoreductase subunit N [Pirellulales bacterium]